MQIGENKILKDVPCGTLAAFPRGAKACGLLEKLAAEKKEPAAKAAVVMGEKMIALEEGLRKLGRREGHDYYWGPVYKDACEFVKGMEYTSKDLELFSLHLASVKESTGIWKVAGLYLSALVNNGADKAYVIHTPKGEEWKFNLLGYENCKRLVVKGDAEYGIGHAMKSGLIIVEGNVGEFAGSDMSGGKLRILGNAGSWLGREMKKGKIILCGDAKEEVGGRMLGGYIHVKGFGGERIGEQMDGGIVWVEKWWTPKQQGVSSLSEEIHNGIICCGKGKGFSATRYTNNVGSQEKGMKQPRE